MSEREVKEVYPVLRIVVARPEPGMEAPPVRGELVHPDYPPDTQGNVRTESWMLECTAAALETARKMHEQVKERLLIQAVEDGRRAREAQGEINRWAGISAKAH